MNRSSIVPDNVRTQRSNEKHHKSRKSASHEQIKQPNIVLACTFTNPYAVVVVNTDTRVTWCTVNCSVGTVDLTMSTKWTIRRFLVTVRTILRIFRDYARIRKPNQQVRDHKDCNATKNSDSPCDSELLSSLSEHVNEEKRESKESRNENII